MSRISARSGYRVFLFNSSRICIGRFSNTCNKFFLYKNEHDLLDKVLSLPIRNGEGILMPTNDRMVDFISRHYDTLCGKFRLSLPATGIIDIAYNKIETYRKAEKLGIPIPLSYFPRDLDEVMSVKNKLDYPIVIKPSVMHSFYSQTGQKVFKCNSPDELISNYRKAKVIIPPNEIIIQEFLAGGPNSLYSFGSFCSGSKVWMSFIAKRIRQKPMDFGIATTFATTVVNTRIHDLSTKFLTGIGYFGLSEVEFMYDEKIKDYKLLEINPRTWKWHSIVNELNINLIKGMIDHLNGVDIKEKHNTIENIGWIERLTDTYVALKEIMNGKMGFYDYLKSIRIPKESAVFSLSDPLPWLAYIILSPILMAIR